MSDTGAGTNLNNLIDALPFGVRVLNDKGELLYANQAFLNITGCGSVEELQSLPTASFYTPESYAEHLRRRDRRKSGTRGSSSYEISVLRKNGEIRHLAVSRKKVIWDGQPQFLVMYQDITVQRERRESVERISRLSRALSTTLDLDKVLNIALEEVQGMCGTESAFAGIALLDDWKQHLNMAAIRGTQSQATQGISIPVSSFPPEVAIMVFDEHRPWIVLNSEAPEVLRKVPGFLAFGRTIAVPLVAGDRSIGVLFLTSSDPDFPHRRKLAAMETCAHEIALAIEHARLYTVTDRLLRQRIADLEALTSLISTLAQGPDLQTVLDNAARMANAAVGTEECSIVLIGESANDITTIATHTTSGKLTGPDSGDPANSEQLWETSLRTLRPFVVEDLQNATKWPTLKQARQTGVQSALSLPLVVSGAAIGAIQFATVSYRTAFAPRQISTAQSIAVHLAAVIENARLHENTGRQKSTLEALVASMNEGLLVIDSHEKVAYCNSAARRIMGMEDADLVGRPVQDFYDFVSTRLAEPEQWEILAALFKEAPRDSRIQWVLRVPERRVVEATVFKIESDRGRLGTGILLRDLSKEEEIDRMKMDFIAIASHELRTPMTSVFGFAEILLKSPNLGAEERQSLEWIYKESERLNSIIDDFLNVSRMETGMLKINPGKISLTTLISGVMSRIRNRYPSHSFVTNVPVDFPGIWADRDKTEQVLYNLLDNASKYSPKGGEVTIKAARLDDRRALIAVSDTGIGIPAHELPRLFTRFHRVSQPGSRGIRGSGLGLYIAKSLVQMMKGNIQVESTPGKGSTFLVTLPLEEDEDRID